MRQLIDQQRDSRNNKFMRNLRSQLPPLKTLVAFEATARLLSLTRAGEELRISREAVSRQIRSLESHLGVKLFERLHRAIALTEAGRQFQEVVTESLENIAAIATDLRGTGQPQRISVSATVAIASFWLTPRLGHFRERFPHIQLGVSVSDTPPDLASTEVDVALRYGSGNWPGVNATRLFNTDTFPVCTAAYLAGANPLQTPADLLLHPLINLDGAAHLGEDWRWWLEGNRVAMPANFGVLGFDNYANVIQAALSHQGIALGYGGLISDLLINGTLIQPLEAMLSRHQGVYAVTTPAPTVLTSLFVDWLLAEATNATAPASA
jgi:LysR family glycine cleavage system transcriptional activator